MKPAIDKKQARRRRGWAMGVMFFQTLFVGVLHGFIPFRSIGWSLLSAAAGIALLTCNMYLLFAALAATPVDRIP